MTPSSGNRRPIVLDTSAYSWFRRGEPRIVAVLETAAVVLVPSIVVGELLAGFARGRREADNKARLDELLAEEFVDTVAVQRATAEHYAVVYRALRSAGTPIPTNDMWIAACARERGAVVVTFDRDFERVSSVESLVLQP